MRCVVVRSCRVIPSAGAEPSKVADGRPQVDAAGPLDINVSAGVAVAESAGLQAYAEPRTMLARARALKQRIRAREVVFGAWLSLTDPVAA